MHSSCTHSLAPRHRTRHSRRDLLLVCDSLHTVRNSTIHWPAFGFLTYQLSGQLFLLPFSLDSFKLFSLFLRVLPLLLFSQALDCLDGSFVISIKDCLTSSFNSSAKVVQWMMDRACFRPCYVVQHLVSIYDYEVRSTGLFIPNSQPVKEWRLCALPRVAVIIEEGWWKGRQFERQQFSRVTSLLRNHKTSPIQLLHVVYIHMRFLSVHFFFNVAIVTTLDCIGL